MSDGSPPATGDPKPMWRSWARSLPSVPADVSRAVTTQLTGFLGQVPGPVLAYIPLPNEVDVRVLTEPGACPGPVVLPRLSEEGTMTLHIDDRRRDVHRLGIEQPLAECPQIAAHELTAVVVPGRIFDIDGYRLGRGGGHYDRLLATIPDGVPIIGATTRDRLVSRLPREAHDRTMSHLAIETGVYSVTSIQLRAAIGRAE